MASKIGYRIAWILTVIIGVWILISGIFTVIGTEFINDVYFKYGLAQVQTLIGIGKIIISILFIIPQTFVFGVLLMSAFFGGTIVTHMIANEIFLPQAILLVLVWVIYALRKPGHFKK